MEITLNLGYRRCNVVFALWTIVKLRFIVEDVLLPFFYFSCEE